jgi:folate-binding protein YgfZ
VHCFQAKLADRKEVCYILGVSDRALLRRSFEAAASGSAVGPVLERAILALTGKDRQDYLNRMCTQDVGSIAPGGSSYSAFLNQKGHLVGEGTVLVLPDRILIDVEPAAGPATRALLEKFIIMDEVEVADLSGELRVLPILGSAGIAGAATQLGGAPVADNGRRGTSARDVYLPAGDAAAVRARLVAAGYVDLDAQVLEAIRISGGAPRFGHDMDEARLPMEAGIARSAISFQKGCYLGQEVVVRATARGQIQKGLVQLAVGEGVRPGAVLRAGGQEVGLVTSVAESPEGRLALGYLRRAHWKVGERLVAEAGEGGEAVVKKLLADDGPKC